MIQFNFPTVMFFGTGCITELPPVIMAKGQKNLLLVTDHGLVQAGIVEKVQVVFSDAGMHIEVYDAVHSNPIENDVIEGARIYGNGNFDGIIALGGGSVLDVAKTIRFMAVHKPPLIQYDDALGGENLIVNPLPSLYAIPTTAGTGSEVGRSSVITMDATGKKTIFFHPDLMPDIAVLDAELTVGLPPHITAATGIDAFTHCIEAYLVDSYHPMADAIALEGLEMILTNLPKCMADGTNLEARGKMLLAASMGAAAFQKGLGMVHSLAHALSEIHNTHHGLANALMLTECIKFTYETALQHDMYTLIEKLKKVNEIISSITLSDIYLPHYNTMIFIKSLGLNLSLEAQGISYNNVDRIAAFSFRDPCHLTHPFTVTKDDFKTILTHAFERNNNDPK